MRAAIPQSFLERLADALDRSYQSPTSNGLRGSMPERGFVNDFGAWQHDADYGDFIFASPVAHLVHQILGGREIQLLGDHVIIKQPGSDVATYWHCDMPYWPLRGDRICSVWTAVDHVTSDSGGVEYVLGSHLGCHPRPVVHMRPEASQHDGAAFVR